MYNVLVIGMWTGPDVIKRSMHTATPRVENSDQVSPWWLKFVHGARDKQFLICSSENFYFTNFQFCSYFLERRVESRQTWSNHENAEFTDHFLLKWFCQKTFRHFSQPTLPTSGFSIKILLFAQMEIYLPAPVSHYKKRLFPG